MYERLEGDSGRPSLSGDDRSTPDVNEAGVTLTAVGSDFSAGALLSSGAAEAEGGRFVGAALAEMIKLRNQVAVLVDLFNDGGLERSALTTQLEGQVGAGDRGGERRLRRHSHAGRGHEPAARGGVVRRAGGRAVERGSVHRGDGGGQRQRVRRRRAVGGQRGEGLRAGWSGEATAVLGQLGDTRFGAAVRGNRNHAEAGAATGERADAGVRVRDDRVDAAGERRGGVGQRLLRGRDARGGQSEHAEPVRGRRGAAGALHRAAA